MPVRGILISLAVNFVVAGTIWYFRGPNAGLICLAIGGLLLILGLLWPKKKSPPPPSITQTQGFNPQFNPQFNPTIQIGVPNAGTAPVEQEKLRHENLVMEFMEKNRQPNRAPVYLVAMIAPAINLTEQQTADATERLFNKGRLYRSSLDAKWDFGYWLRDS